MDAEQKSERVQSLDLRHQSSCHEYNMVVRDEEARRLKLRSVLLRNENTELGDQLAHKDHQITQLFAKCDMLRGQLATATQKGRQHEKQARLHAREISNLKEEMDALNGVTQDSAKLLTEKLALSRENALLKPEIEHLQSQLAHQKEVLAEKLALERQLNALEVELANEKRAAQKAASRRSRDDEDAEQEAQQRIQDLEKQVAKERRAAQKATHDREAAGSAAEEELRELREKLTEAEKTIESERLAAAQASKTNKKAAEAANASKALEQLRRELAGAAGALEEEKADKERVRREGEKAAAEAESWRLALEERLDNTKARLRETREQLKRCRAELQEKTERQQAATDKTKQLAAAKAGAGTKRRANEISSEETMLLHTPTARGGERPKRPVKKGFAPAGVGEKSTFSITPFLNKTVNLSDASLRPQGDNTTATTSKLSSVVQFHGADADADAAPPADSSMPDAPDAPEEAAAARPIKAATAGAKKPRGRPPTATTKALAESSPSKQNGSMPKRRKAPGVTSTLEKVAEGGEEEEEEEGQAGSQENQSNEDAAPETSAPPVALPKKTLKSTALRTTTAAAVTAAVQPEPKKKKRKLLGGAPKTLFDGGGDADDAEKMPAPTAASKRPLTKIGLGGTAGAAAKKATALGGVKNAFAGAAFSPLKRERRGVQASFLG